MKNYIPVIPEENDYKLAFPAIEDPQPNGMPTPGISERFAREDHVHPLQEGSGGGEEVLTYPCTFHQLLNLLEQNKLQIGQNYLITDYSTTAVSYSDILVNTAGTNEPLIVTAIATNKLHEKAISTLYPADEIWYDINNDSGKYTWADAANGKGVIYRRIDGNNNDCPYDHRGIKFAVYNDNNNNKSSSEEWSKTKKYSRGQIVWIDRYANGNVFSYYLCACNHDDINPTSSYYPLSNVWFHLGNSIDNSGSLGLKLPRMNKFIFLDGNGYYYYGSNYVWTFGDTSGVNNCDAFNVHDNKIEARISSDGKYFLPNITFYGLRTFGNYISDSYNLRFNLETIGNTIKGCRDCVFQSLFESTLERSSNNVFLLECRKINFYEVNNSFVRYCHDLDARNSSSLYFYDNYDIKINGADKYFANYGCYFFDMCNNITLDRSCGNINMYKYASNIIIGGYCNNIYVGEFCRNLKIGDNCNYITGDHYCNNDSGDHICDGTTINNVYGIFPGSDNNEIGRGCNSIKRAVNSSGSSNYNKIGNECSDITLSGSCHSNILTNFVKNVTLDNDCNYNTIRKTFNGYNSSVKLGQHCTQNEMWIDGAYVTLEANASRNKIGNNNAQSSLNVAIGYNSCDNVIGNHCTGSITIGQGSNKNIIGNNCRNISIADYALNQKIGNDCENIGTPQDGQDITFGVHCQNISFEEYARYSCRITFGSDCKNINIPYRIDDLEVKPLTQASGTLHISFPSMAVSQKKLYMVIEQYSYEETINEETITTYHNNKHYYIEYRDKYNSLNNSLLCSELDS